MIRAFMQITESIYLKLEPEESNGRYIVYLLEAFVNILQFDEGIFIFLNTGILKRFN